MCQSLLPTGTCQHSQLPLATMDTEASPKEAVYLAQTLEQERSKRDSEQEGRET